MRSVLCEDAAMKWEKDNMKVLVFWSSASGYPTEHCFEDFPSCAASPDKCGIKIKVSMEH